MKVEDIVEALNNTLKEERKGEFDDIKGLFVLQRNVEVNPQFKVYTTLSAKLWYVQNKKKYLIFKQTITDRVLNGKDEKLLRAINIALIQGILALHKTDKWEKIKIGEYGISDNESLLD